MVILCKNCQKIALETRSANFYSFYFNLQFSNLVSILDNASGEGTVVCTSVPLSTSLTLTLSSLSTPGHHLFKALSTCSPSISLPKHLFLSLCPKHLDRTESGSVVRYKEPGFPPMKWSEHSVLVVLGLSVLSPYCRQPFSPSSLAQLPCLLTLMGNNGW